MNLTIAPEVLDAFPGMRIVAVLAHGIDNAKSYPALHHRWTQTWIEAGTTYDVPNSQSHPRVHPWRDAFRPLGISGKKFPSSIEALLRRALKGGTSFSINPLVDFYNAVSLRHIVPAGGFDLADVAPRVDLRFTRAGDTFRALDQDAAVGVPPGEVAYACGNTVLTRHFVWRQAQHGSITPRTESVLFVSEVLREIPGEVVGAVREELVSGLRDFFGVESNAVLLSETNLHATW